MKKPCCQNCAYAVTMRMAEQVFWVCTNAPGMAGRLTPVESTGCCRQYRKRRTRSLRLAPPESTDPSIRYIPLTKGKFAMVDAADYERVSRYTWCALGSGQRMYACRRGRNGKTILLHRFLTNCPPGMVVDHIDGNGLNDRQSNLRVCTQSQNTHNRRPWGRSSKYKGVTLYKPTRKWLVRVWHDYRSVYCGYFEDEIEAARAYDRKAYELIGEYAYLNFPEEIGVAGRPVTSDKGAVTSDKAQVTGEKQKVRSRE